MAAGACGDSVMLFRSMIGLLPSTKRWSDSTRFREERIKYLASDELKSVSAVTDDHVSDVSLSMLC